MLNILFKDGRSDPVQLVAPGKTIGRRTNNDIVINVAGVSGFHVDLQVDGDRVTMTEVSPIGGTHLNGDLLSGPTSIRAGDLITIQGVELQVFDDEVNDNAKTLVLSGTATQKLARGVWCLVARSGPERGQLIPVTQLTEIGRALDCDISILEPVLSRKHAEIEPVDGKLVIRDLASANGTYVNGKKIKAGQEVQLHDRDILQFKKIKFRVQGP